jgi:glycosyltransferase involved in cell wall biosynthesis
MAKVAIFIPAFNEERSIGSAVLRAKKFGKVYVVDDGSDDATACVAADAGAQVISHGRNLGYGAALQTIWKSAKKPGAEIVVIMDGDYQHDPSDIPLLVAPIASGEADVCIGSRFLGKFVHPPPGRKQGVQLLNHLAGMHAQGKKTVDFQCGFRAFSMKAVKAIRFVAPDYSAGAEMLVSAIRHGLKVVEVPVNVRYYASKGISFGQGAGLLGYFVKQLAHRKPLVFFGGAAAALLAASAGFGIFVVNRFYTDGQLPVGSAFLTVFCGIAGLVMLLIGINLYTLEAILSKKGGA